MEGSGVRWEALETVTRHTLHLTDFAPQRVFLNVLVSRAQASLLYIQYFLISLVGSVCALCISGDDGGFLLVQTPQTSNQT